MQPQQCSWSGITFSVFERDAQWNNVPGVYIFSMRYGISWYPLYVGQASSFEDRFSNHEKWNAAVARGMTHVHAIIVHNQADRDAIEQNLIKTLQPPLNIQHRDTLLTR